jgi:hypothetical protein
MFTGAGERENAVASVPGSLHIAGQLVGSGLLAVAAAAIAVIIIAAIAIFRCRQADIPKVIEAFGSWWPWHRRR